MNVHPLFAPSDREAALIARNADLEEEVAYYRREMGLSVEATRLHRLAAELQIYPQTARVLLALYQATGRVLSKAWLEGVLETQDETAVASNAVAVHVYLARDALGQDAIDTVWRSGYRMTSAGIARLAAVFEPAEPLPHREGR